VFLVLIILLNLCGVKLYGEVRNNHDPFHFCDIKFF
jgi:uncharacterized membrane protein YwaF